MDMGLCVGAKFGSLEECKNAVREQAIKDHVELSVLKSDRSRYRVKCAAEGCPWMLLASVLPDSREVAIKTTCGEHSCGGVNQRNNKEACAKWVTEKYLGKFLEQPSYKPSDLVADVRRDHGVEFTYRVAWLAKENAMAELYGGHEESYKLLHNFCSQLMDANPGTICLIQQDEQKRFTRLFVAFGASLNGYPVIGLDGTFLTSKYRGILLTATAVDARGSLFPLAYGWVGIENDSNWSWFLSQLHGCLTISTQVVFLSDRQKGILEGVSAVFGENALHGYCLRHLAENFKKEFKSTELVKLLWKATRVETIPKFEEVLQTIKTTNAEAATWLLDEGRHPRFWAEAHFPGYRFGHLTSNIAESLNSWLLDARDKPILSMLTMICDKMMTWFYDWRKEGTGAWIAARQSPFAVVKEVDDEIKAAIARAHYYRVLPSTDYIFKIVTAKHEHVVNLQVGTCSCLRWHKSGIPCAHAAASILFKKQQVYMYTYDAYRLFYCATYEGTINPVPHRGEVEANTDMLPPQISRLPGRPKKRRIRSAVEEEKKAVKCSRCKLVGRTCRTAD